MDRNALLKLSFFRKVNIKDLQEVLQKSFIESYPSGSIIIQQGIPQSWFFLIIKGHVEVYIDEEQRTYLNSLGVEEYFGEMSALTGDPPSATVITAENTTVLKIPHSDFLKLLRLCPELNNHLIQQLLIRLKKTNRGVSQISVKERALRNQFAQEKRYTYDKFIAVSPSMEKVRFYIEEFSRNDAPLLIQGEAGTGKELAAAIIHYNSKRAGFPFIVINCSVLTDSDWKDVLLGKNNNGRLALAEGGSILFKHIEDLPAAAYPLLDGLLKEALQKNHLRIMAATNKSPFELQSTLSAGIWSNLSQKILRIPPLRDRKEDIAPLTRYFIVKHSHKYSKGVLNITYEAMRLLNSYSYLSANVKELEDVIMGAVLNSSGSILTHENLHFGIFSHQKDFKPRIGLALGGGGAKGSAHAGVLEILERENIKIDYIAGTSIGAAIGALYAGGLSPTEIKKVTEKVNFDQFFNISFSGQGLFKTDRLAAFINKLLGNKTFEDLKIPFAAVAANLNTGEEVILREGPLAPAVCASCTFPGIFKPVCINGKTLIDGGLVNNVPASVVRAMGANFVISVDLKDIGDHSSSGIVQTILQTFHIMVSRNAGISEQWTDVIIKPQLDNYDFLNFKPWNEIYTLGMQSAIEVLPELHSKLRARKISV